MRCPICRSDATASLAKPFCSERCRQADLVRWLDGSYRLGSEPVRSDAEDENQPTEDQS